MSKQLEEEIATLREQVRRKEWQLFEIQRTCKHKWTAPKYDPIIRPGGSSPGDTPGTMGVDFRGPCSWPEERTPRWSRTCTVCNKVEYTSKTKVTAEAADFGDR